LDKKELIKSGNFINPTNPPSQSKKLRIPETSGEDRLKAISNIKKITARKIGNAEYLFNKTPSILSVLWLIFSTE